MQWIHVLMLLAWAAGWVLLFRVPRLPRRDDAEAPDGEVTIVVPARNEEATLPLLLGDLALHRPPGARVVVVDDHSEDRTAEVAGGFDFVEVVSPPPLEPGWVGKSWACHHGARRAPPGALVFLDADVRIHTDVVARAVAEQARTGGLVTLWPYHAVQRPYEHLSALFGVVSLMAIGCGSLIPDRRTRAGLGPFMATTTADYATVGGHEAIRESVIEDFAIARRYEAAGLPVRNFGGGRDTSFRMYPGGFRSLLDGWTKNYGLGAFAIAPWRLALILLWLAVSIGIFKWGGKVGKPIPTAVLGLYMVQMGVMFKQVGRFGVLDALVYPLHVVFLVLVFLRSLWRTYVLRRVTWRGRSIPTGPSRNV